MKRVLVTGAAGFIGRTACRQLRDAGWSVIAVGRRAAAPPGFEGIEWVSENLLEKSAPERLAAQGRATHLLHLAWVTEHGTYWESPQNHLWLEASKQLLQAFAVHGGQRAVAAGTCAEYDWSTADPAASPPRPASLYGRSKLAFHDWARSWTAQNSLSFAWGRVFFTFGPGENPNRLVPYVCRQLLQGEPVLCGNGAAVRDFIPIADLARLFATLVTLPDTGDFDLGRGKGMSVRQLVESLANITHGHDLLRFGARADRPGEPAWLVARHLIPGTRVEANFQDRLEQSLRETLDWWRHADTQPR